MKKAIDQAHRLYETFERNRSECMDLSGRIRADSKAAINFIVSGGVERGKKTLEGTPAMVKKLGGMLRRTPYLYSVPALNEGLEEYVEAVLLLGYVEGRKDFPTPGSLGINHEAYIGGLCDMTGELVRLARNTPEKAEAISRDVACLYGRAVGMYVKRNSKIRSKLQDLERNVARLEEIVYDGKRR